MRIGFTGAHGTGKSTLLYEMIKWRELGGHCFTPGLTRAKARASGLKINQQGNFEGQKELVKNMTWHLKTLPNLVVDRTLLDIYAYTVHHRDSGSVTSQELNYIRNRVKQYQHLFDVVFYIRPEFETKDDGVRSADPGFALAIAAQMDHIVTHEPLGTREIITVTGTVKERLATIRDWVRNHENKV